MLQNRVRYARGGQTRMLQGITEQAGPEPLIAEIERQNLSRYGHHDPALGERGKQPAHVEVILEHDDQARRNSQPRHERFIQRRNRPHIDDARMNPVLAQEFLSLDGLPHEQSIGHDCDLGV